MEENTYIVDRLGFWKIYNQISGRVFYRELPDGTIEVKLALHKEETLHVIAPILIKPKLDEDCEHCEGTGKVFTSCCGDDIRGNDIDLCPTCYEHCGDEGEDCEDCKGTGKLNLITS